MYYLDKPFMATAVHGRRVVVYNMQRLHDDSTAIGIEMNVK